MGPRPSRAWSPAQNSRGVAPSFQTGVEPGKQNGLDPLLRRPKAYLWISPPCFQVMCGHPVGIVRVPAIYKRIPSPVARMDEPADGTRLRTIRRVDLLSTGTSCRRLELVHSTQGWARFQPQANAYLLTFKHQRQEDSAQRLTSYECTVSTGAP